MKRIFVAALCLAAVGCSDVPEATAPEGFDLIVGKQLVSGQATFLMRADGTMGGSLDGEPIVGTWKFDGGDICSEYSAPERLANVKPCSRPVVTGNTVIFNRRDGSQSPVYSIEG